MPKSSINDPGLRAPQASSLRSCPGFPDISPAPNNDACELDELNCSPADFPPRSEDKCPKDQPKKEAREQSCAQESFYLYGTVLKIQNKIALSLLLFTTSGPNITYF